MKFLPIALLVLASMVEAKPSYASRAAVSRKLEDNESQDNEQQDEEQESEEQGEEQESAEQDEQQEGEETGNYTAGEETGNYTAQVDYSAGYYTGSQNGYYGGSNTNTNNNNAWSGTSAWYKYSQYQEADDGEEETQSNSLQFEGCHTFTTSSNNYYTNEDVNSEYYGNSDGSNEKYSTTKSYVVMTVPYKNQNSNNGNNGDSSNGSDLMRVSIPLDEYIVMLASGKETELENLCAECSNLISYCLPQEEGYMGLSGYTKNSNNQNQIIYWDQPWNYLKSEAENMGDYYGVSGAISCNACMANSCYSEYDENFVEYMAKGVYGYDDVETFYQNVLSYNESEQTEYIVEMSEALEMLGTCNAIGGTGYYSGWTCTTNGEGIQLAVFSDNECLNYVRGKSYFDMATEEDLEKFTAAMEVVNIENDLKKGVSCADKTWTTGANIAYGEANSQYQKSNQYQNSNGYMNVNNMNDMCANIVKGQIEGEVDLSVCENEKYQSRYENQQAQNQDQGYSTYTQKASTEYEIDLNALEAGDVSSFCELISQEFGSAQGNKQLSDDWQSAYDKSKSVSTSDKIKQQLEKMDAGEIALWSMLAIAMAVTLIAAMVFVIKGCTEKGDVDEGDKILDGSDVPISQAEYTLA
jgi:hypothetical protein